MRCLLFRAVFITLLLAAHVPALADSLVVVADFEGASVADVVIDQTARTINFRPGGQPQRGWPCWWYFRIDGLTPGETLTLRCTPAIPLLSPHLPSRQSSAKLRRFPCPLRPRIRVTV